VFELQLRRILCGAGLDSVFVHARALPHFSFDMIDLQGVTFVDTHPQDGTADNMTSDNAYFDGAHIQSIDQIREGWAQAVQEASDLFGSYSESDFAAEREGRWTVAKNVDHLTRAATPVAKGLGIPKFLIRWKMGRGPGTSRSLPEVQKIYKQILAEGAQVRGRFVPEGKLSQQKALAQWDACGKLLLKKLDRWSDSQLDQYQVPHPLIGMLTIREILFFTIFHTHHHLQNVKSP